MAARVGPIHDNIAILRQGIAALDRVRGDLYAEPAYASGASMGSQFRHILDHYQAFLNGLESGRIDYDHRERARSIETEIEAARARAERICSELERMADDRLDDPSMVNACTAGPPDRTPVWTPSTVRRELAFLLSHTVHHYALINLLARAAGVELPGSFGVAPSTLAYRQLTA
jgi:uncharacterized damage-inducible protein DinB